MEKRFITFFCMKCESFKVKLRFDIESFRGKCFYPNKKIMFQFVFNCVMSCSTHCVFCNMVFSCAFLGKAEDICNGTSQ